MLFSVTSVHLHSWHAGLLDVVTACSEVSQDSTTKAAAAAALWQATMEDLSAQWPSLCQRLLLRAVQHVAGDTSQSKHPLGDMWESI